MVVNTLGEFALDILGQGLGSDLTFIAILILVFFVVMIFLARLSIASAVLIAMVLLDGMACGQEAILCDAQGAFTSPLLSLIFYLTYILAATLIGLSVMRLVQIR